MKTIFHIADLDSWSLVLGNVKNLIKEYEDKTNYDIIVVANSNAVKGYLTKDVINSIKDLTSDKVTFKACNNALNSFSIEKGLLIKQIEIISAGVYELTLRQSEGYAYIKA